MPIYLFQHDKTGEIKEVIQRMTESHVLKGHTRIFVNPQIGIDQVSRIDPWSQKDFTEKTGKKHGTIGDLMDRSAELSEKRAKIAGVDPIKEAQIDAYEKRTHKKHSSKIPKSIELDVCNKSFKVIK